MKGLTFENSKLIYDPSKNDDTVVINFIDHPKPKFNLWQRIKAIFIKPKFSVEALEPADLLLTNSQIEYLKTNFKYSKELPDKLSL